MPHRAATAERLHALRPLLTPEQRQHAHRKACATPTAARWTVLLDRGLLAIGAGLLLAGVLHFFAWNWGGLSGPIKLVLPMLGTLSAALLAAWVGFESPTGKVALTLGSGLTGVALAVHGQVYQAGADSWTLFALWGLVSLPWALLARAQALWLMVLAVSEVALWKVWGQRMWPGDVWELGAALAVVTAAAWWLRERVGGGGRWMPRALAAFTFTLLTALSVSAVVEGWDRLTVGMVFGLLALPALGGLCLRRRDLFVASAALGSWILALTVALTRLLAVELDLDELAALPVGIAVVAMAALAAGWLRRRSREGWWR